jgi:hypothetical protein
MKIERIIGILTTLVVGSIVLIDYFSAGQSPVSGAARLFIRLSLILAAVMLFFGLANLLRFHWRQWQTKASGRFYGLILVISVLITLVVGILSGGPYSATVQKGFLFVLKPLESSLYALMAFFSLKAAYRYLRIKSLEAFVFTLVTLLVLLGAVPGGGIIWGQLPQLREWLMSVPVLAGSRGILIGISLAVLLSGGRLILGLERPYDPQ